MQKIIKICLYSLCLATFFVLPAWAQDNRPRLGVSVTELRASPLLLQHLRLADGEGLLIRDVVGGSAAQRDGLSQGDILLAVDAKAMSSVKALVDYLATLPAQSKVTLDVIQKGEHRQLSLALDDLPDTIEWEHRAAPRARALPPMLPSAPPFSSSLPSSGTQQLMYRSQVQTKNGIELSTVVLTGDPKDPNSEVNVELGGQKFQCKMKDLNKLPESAQNAVNNALAHSPSVQLKFGNFGAMSFDEMFENQMMQMRRFEEDFMQRNASPRGTLPPANASGSSSTPDSPIHIIPQKDKAKVDQSRMF